MSAPLAYNMKGAVVAAGLSATSLKQAIKSGRLKTHRSSEDADGNPTGTHIILHDDLKAFLEGLPVE